MAAKKKAASAEDAGKITVAFALRDHVEGEGDDAVTFTAGQRLELEQKEFDGLAKAGICAEGVFVKMKTAVEGGRYSLKPHDTTWLAPHVYEAWKAAGYCEPTEDDPQVGAVLKAREDALREAVTERDAARLSLAESQSQRDALLLEMAAAKAQAETVIEFASDILDGDDETMEPVKAELQKLIDMLPDQIEGAGDGSEPELNLN
ncbi:hypothetical protein [Shimia sediminis]|uniref:hypothetical protein n=1 Tax=Shimia sediminis TaxID=2497945 RepID=UPI000F8DB986|nr:hypothetical protein [Shimia sediminis]